MSCSYGQLDTIELPSVLIMAPYNQPGTIASFTVIHKADTNAIRLPIPLIDLLANDGIYFKSYAAQGLSTAGSRGFGAGHTKVFWNGILLNSPLNGTMDLNVLNIYAAATDVTLVKSNMPVQGGISGPGGSIWIEPSDANLRNEANVTLSAGSYNTYKVSSGIHLAGKKISNILQVGGATSENNYKYKSVQDFRRPYVRLEESETAQWNILNNMKLKLSGSQLLFNLFYNENKRSVPQTITSSGPAAFQKDKTLKTGFSWQKGLKANANISANLGYNYDELLYYFVKGSPGHSSYYVHTLPFSIKGDAKVFGHDVKINLSHTDYFIQSSEVNVPNESDNNGTLEVLSREDRKIFYGGLIQKQFTSFYDPSLSFRVYSGINMFHKFKVSLSHSKSHQFPTLNDRYWPISGNERLKVEDCTSWELNASLAKTNFDNYSLMISSAVFYNQVDNWIAWVPGANDLWRPFNVQKVNSRGVDLSINQTYQFHHDLNVFVNYNFTFSRPEIDKVYVGSPGVVGKTLSYVPDYQSNLVLNGQYKSSLIVFSWRVTGKRFTSSDNNPSYSLPAYSLFDMRYQMRLNIAKDQIVVGLKLNNIFNTDYETILYRPLAGRNFELSLGFVLRGK